MNKLPSIHLNQVEFKTLIQEASNKYNIGEAMIEKDYWVTWCINYLFGHSPWRDHLGFKGGTCMAKAYDVISRFSEDIDILLDWRLLGYRTKEPMVYSQLCRRTYWRCWVLNFMFISQKTIRCPSSSNTPECYRPTPIYFPL